MPRQEDQHAVVARAFTGDPERPPTGYSRPADHTGLIVQCDVPVPMRDAVALSVDIHRPEGDHPR